MVSWPQKEWLTLSEVAEILGVHPSTVRIWANQGKIPVYRTNGGHRRFRRSELELWMLSRNQAKEVNIPREFIQAFLKNVRTHLADKAPQQGWYQKLSGEIHKRYRESGAMLVQRMWTYLSADDTSAEAEAKALGYEFATSARLGGLTEGEALRGFLFFTEVMTESLIEVVEKSQIRSPHVWATVMRKINTFVSEVATSMLETYQAYNQGLPVIQE